MTLLAGIREALIWLVASLAVVAAGAGLWVTFSNGPYLHTFGVAALAVGLAIPLTGSGKLSAIGTREERAFFGLSPDRTKPSEGRILTHFGIFLLVSLPLICLGAALL